MGMATANISNGVNGEVISFGTLVGIDTRGDTASAIAVGDETWAEGDILYAHPTVAGKLTKVRPQHDLAVAFITVRHASTGQIAVRIIPGNNHLEWLHDVAIDGTPADNELLAYNSASSLWINQTAEEAGVANLSGATFTGNVAGTNISVTGNVNATTFNGNLSATQISVSATASFNKGQGSAPFTVASTTEVTNLTAQFANTAFSVAISNVTSMGTNVSTFLTTPNSINFLNTITDETGTGNVVFSTSPVLTTPNIGAAIGTSVNVTGQLISTVATGTAPLAVTSTTKVTNLNADLLDGYNTSTNADANTVSVRDTNGSIKANVFYGDVLGSSITVGDNISANTINTTSLANVAQLTVGSTATFNKPEGSAPFIVVSTTQVTNLTAQFVTNGVYTTTTSLPNVTSVNSTTIPNSATLLTTGNIGSTVQAYDNDIASLANTINAVGFLYNNGAGTFSYTSIPNDATTAASANGASTIVARDANGSFAGNVITATKFIGIIDGGSA
jgi:hypothetical protein